MRKLLALLSVLCLVGNCYGQSFTVNEGKLSDYLKGGSFEVGDKVFSNFVYSRTNDMPKAKDINVLGGADVNGNFGFRLTGAFGTSAGTNSDAILSFTVTVDNTNNLVPLAITDAHIQGNPNVTGGTGSMSVTETFTDPVFNDDLSNNTLSIFDNVPPGARQNMLDTTFLNGYDTLNVQKDIEAISTRNGTETLSFVDQSFSQGPNPRLTLPPVEETPEPSTIVLGFIGLVGFFLGKRFIGLAM